MKKTKKVNKLYIIIPTIISVCIVAYFFLNMVFSPYWDSVYPPNGYLSLSSLRISDSAETVFTKEQACEDLDYIVKCLNRVHPLFDDEIPQHVQEMLDAEKNSFDEQVTSIEIYRSAAHLFSEIGDSHNMISPTFPRLYLTDYIEKLKQGYSLEVINGVDLYTVFQEKKSLFAYEIEEWGIQNFINILQTKDGFELLEIETEKVEFTYLSPNGEQETVIYTDKDFDDYETAASVLSVEVETVDSPDYSYSIDQENNLAVFTLNQCTYDSDFKKVMYDFFTEVIYENIGNIVVDLRENSGGNSQVADEFIMYLNQESVKRPGGYWRLGPYTMNWEAREEEISHYDENLFDGNVFVMTSASTFSSATMFAELIQDNSFGMVVGETCGNMPAGYGDVVVFQTPNSLLTFQISSKSFDRIDTDKAGEPLTPDFPCPADDALNVIKSLVDEK